MRIFETSARKLIAGGSLSELGANGRRSAFAAYGPGQLTPVQVVELWRELIDFHDVAKNWLTLCSSLGLEPDLAESNGLPDPLPPPVPSPVPVAGQAIYAWMLDHLVAITECQSDYIWLRIPPGLQYV